MKQRIVLVILVCCGFAAHAALAVTRPDYEGFPDRYALQIGDLNGDSLTDLHLRYRPPVTPILLDDITIPLVPPRPVADFVLQQNSSGGFSIVALSPSQNTAVVAWPVVSAQLINVDANVDGYLDLLIRGVSAVVPGAQDVIVFAPTSSGAAPSSVRNWDTAFDEFMRDYVGWVEDPYYYDSGIYYACLPTLAWVRVEHSDIWGNTWYTYELRQVNACGNWFDPTGFSIPALQFLNQFIVSLGYGDLIPQEGESPAISQIMHDALGVPIMRGTLETGGQNYGVPASLLPVLTDPEAAALRNQFFDRSRLVALFTALWKMAKTANCQTGVAHYYNFSEAVCPHNQDPGCTVSEVYFGEMVFHPAPGFWDRQTPVKDGEQGYAELGCTRTVPNACDPIRGKGFPPAAGVFDGGPIVLHRFDSQYHHQNATREGHLFHSGTVDRYAKLQTGGLGIEIQTVGNGTGACPSINYYGGIYVFRKNNKFIECHVAGGCNKTHDTNPLHQ